MTRSFDGKLKHILFMFSSVLFLHFTVSSQCKLPLIKTLPEVPQVCENLSVQFFDSTKTNDSCIIKMREWDFGDGSPKIKTQNPIHVFAGGKLGDTTYRAQLSIKDKFDTWSSQSISIVVFKKKSASSNCIENPKNKISTEVIKPLEIKKIDCGDSALRSAIWQFDSLPHALGAQININNYLWNIPIYNSTDRNKIITPKNENLNNDQNQSTKTTSSNENIVISINTEKETIDENSPDYEDIADSLSEISSSSIDTETIKLSEPGVEEKTEPILAKTDFTSAEVITNGKVISGDEPLSGTRIIIKKDGEFYREITTDKNGEFKTLLNRNGLYIIEANKDGFELERQTIAPGQLNAEASNLFLNFRLQKKGKEPLTEAEKLDALSREALKKEFLNILINENDIKTVGIVFKDNEIVEGANVRIFNGNDLIGSTKTDEFGRFKVALEKNKKFTFRISKENYTDEIINFNPSLASYQDFLSLDFEIEKYKEKNQKVKNIHFIGTVSCNGIALPNVDANVFLEGDVFEKIETDTLGHFQTSLSPNDLFTIILKKEDYYSNQISFFPNQKTKKDTLILHFDMPIRDAVIKRGTVQDNGNPIYQAEVKVYQDGVFVTSAQTDIEGLFEIALRSNQEYTFLINRYNYFQQELKVSTFGENGESKELINAEMRKLKTAQSEKINNIYFEFNASKINLYAGKELKKLADFIKANPQIKEIEISAFTDNRGSETFNKNLSQKRAEACVQYLISLGINKNMLKAKGYGESNPVIKNPLSEEEYAKNRRVEFKIVKTYK